MLPPSLVWSGLGWAGLGWAGLVLALLLEACWVIEVVFEEYLTACR